MAANITTADVRQTGNGVFSTVAANVRHTLARWEEQSRIRRELRSMSRRDLADLGLAESDIEDVVRGTYRRP